ncbi:hypothetical protein BKA58DRAFT_409914 [Alternaria rosae]|uniref:uncharacterized protein n=1 Tax=Alternaria rosae TaxID=1187941 RepID=UPI001E8E0909|nr:uncharacterized protein BKA58DRAFT_409914 [Alternaria rosae]KAH6875596.1 hypothetical protein BKA58DRAFT_409914 [Alternaria rosae]
MSSQDPRSSSTQSLVPDPSQGDTGRRRLMLVFIHGFMGNETSFRSFPAHVHNLVTITLAETHVVHTKIYPRYKSRDSLEIARDNFSRWLAPHEDQWTDVVLLGHSMGGLLAADIALAFRHRIIGIVNFDVPFLGMHPGIIKAGLGSIFSSPPTPQDAIVQDADAGKRPSRMSTIFNPKPTDPNYNPAFPNDVNLPNRKGWENSLHWLTKHYKDGLKEATKGLVKSHFEFGSAMADYKELKNRYARVRALEEDDESKRRSGYGQGRTVPRVRFVNYYTASTGRPKKPKSPKSPSPKSPSPSRSSSQQLQHQDSNMSASSEASRQNPAQTEERERSRSSSITSSEPEMTHVHPEPMADSPPLSIKVHEHREDGVVPVSPQDLLSATSPIAPQTFEESAREDSGPPNLPEIPPIPQEPPFVDLMQFSDKAQRKAAEKEHDQALKVYQKAVKTRNKTINERTKMEEKWEKEKAKEKKDREKEEKKKQEEREKARKEQEKEELKKAEEANNMSAEDKQRQKEREQRQAEAEQREAEARQRQREADLRDGKIPTEDKAEPKRATIELEEDIGAIELGDDEPAQHNSQHPYANYQFSRSGIMRQDTPDGRADSSYTLSTMDSQNSHRPKTESEESAPAKPKKLKKFCMLPPKDADGNKDPTWIRVFMENMDEVTAHTSLFFINETYEKLVGDVGARIEDWVREADSMRLVREMSEMEDMKL